MYKEEYELMFRNEERHWWFLTKRNIVFDQIERNMPDVIREPRILDVGFGTGIVLAGHAGRGDAFGVDVNPHAIRNAAKREAGHIVCASAMDLPFLTGTFDIVTCLDVLYHQGITSDSKVAAEIFRVLKPGGLFIMTDSALRCLRGRHDIVMQAARRYNRREVRRLLLDAGFVVKKTSYMNFFLFPVVFLRRKISNLLPGPPHSDVGEVNSAVNIILKAIYGTEKFLLRVINLPVGSSVIAVANKPC